MGVKGHFLQGMVDCRKGIPGAATVCQRNAGKKARESKYRKTLEQVVYGLVLIPMIICSPTDPYSGP